MSKFIVTLTKRDLELVSALCTSFKDHFRGDPDLIKPVVDFEKSLTKQTAGAYEADTMYDV